MFDFRDNKAKFEATKNRVPSRPSKEDSRHCASYSPFAVPVVAGNDLLFAGMSPNYNKMSSTTYFEQCFDRISVLAQGSFGVVYKAYLKDDGKCYAVKKYKKPFRDTSHRQKHLEGVKRYLQIPNHENIVTGICAWEEAGYLFVQMEYCAKMLYEYLSVWEKVTESKLWDILLDLTLAIHHLHSQNLLHLDIKPENVLVSENGSCKLGDFDLMKSIVNNRVADGEDGDSRYLAPEILQDVFTKAADIFSLGLTLLEVTSNLVVPGNGDAWHLLRSGNLPDFLFSETSQEFRDLIRKMLSHDPSLRPSALELLQHRRLKALLISRFYSNIPFQMMNALKTYASHTKDTVAYYGLKIFNALGLLRGGESSPRTPERIGASNSLLVESPGTSAQTNEDNADVSRRFLLSIFREGATNGLCCDHPTSRCPSFFFWASCIQRMGNGNSSPLQSRRQKDGPGVVRRLFQEEHELVEYSTPRRSNGVRIGELTLRKRKLGGGGMLPVKMARAI